MFQHHQSGFAYYVPSDTVRYGGEKCKEIPRLMCDCKSIFISAAIVFCEKRRQMGTSLSCRHFFLSLWGFKTQILLCHMAPLQSVTDAGAPAEKIELFHWRLGRWNYVRFSQRVAGRL